MDNAAKHRECPLASPVSAIIRVKNRGFTALLFLLISAALTVCSPRKSMSRTNQKHGDAKPLVAVSILPQTWFVRRLAGERVRTLVLVGPGQNPHSYEPTPAQMKELAQAGAWVLSGAEFEVGLLPKIRDVFSGLTIINGTDGVSFRMLDPEHSAARIMARGDELSDDEDHGEHGIDRHTWLGSGPAKILGASIRDALALIDPAGEDAYNENYMALVREIDDEFAALRIELLPLKGGVVYVYHPSFGYFLDEFGIRQEAVETGGKEPGPRELGRLISEMKREQAPAIFVQAQFPVNAARAVAQATGAQLVSLDPLSADWLANIRVMGNALKAAAYGGNF